MATGVSIPLGRVGVLDRLDRAVGDRVADGFCSHHRRRLRNLGSDVLDAPAGGWAADAAAPSDGNRLSVLIDGEQYLAALREALEGAESHVYLAGWFLSPDFQLAHDPPLTARDLLAGLASGCGCACCCGRDRRRRSTTPPGVTCVPYATPCGRPGSSTARSTHTSGRCTATTRRWW